MMMKMIKMVINSFHYDIMWMDAGESESNPSGNGDEGDYLAS